MGKTARRTKVRGNRGRGRGREGGIGCEVCNEN